MDHVTAASLMAQARDRSNGKPLQNNTRLYERGEDFAVQLHYTDVVTIHADGSYTLNTGGWETVTTRDRITSYAPVYGKLRSSRGDWQLPVRPSVSDPEPAIRHRTVPKPFHAPDPGPEPEKSPDGCVAGERYGHSEFDSQKLAWSNELRAGYLTNDGNVPDAEFERATYDRTVVSPSRRVLQWIDSILDGHDLLYVRTWTTRWVEYGEESYGHATAINTRWERCPHCKEFAQRHDAWRIAMHGGYRQVGRRYRHHDGYALMVEMLERFGTREAWQEAYITEFRQQREDRKVHREWETRNWVRFYDGVRVDGDGFVPRKDAEAIFKAERAAKRAERRREIEHEQRQREARQLQRFKDRVRRKRGDNFDKLVVELGNDVRAWKARLEES